MLVTCEHGGNRIPRDLAPSFRGMRRVLATHGGYDAGALLMARTLAAALEAPLVASTTSRLVIDLNRSLGHRSLWSDATRTLPPATRDRIVRRHYHPYRSQVEAFVAQARAMQRPVFHFSSHSFTPVLDGITRTADVGLLYDPARPGEVKLSRAVQAALAEAAPSLRVRRNYPYAGKADGLTTWLRKRYTPVEYVGIEIELNQAIVAAPPAQWRWLRDVVVTTIMAAMRRARET